MVMQDDLQQIFRYPRQGAAIIRCGVLHLLGKQSSIGAIGANGSRHFC